MEKKKLFFLSTLHILLDSHMGFFAIYLVIAALDPLKSALIITVSNFAGNILQPFMGYGADKLRGKIPLFLGMFLTSVSMSLIGITTHYGSLFVLVLFGNLGSSLFHPAGANIAGAAGLTKKDAAFAIFVTIGTIGFALSQPYFSAFTAKYGTERSFILAFPTLIFAFYYLFFGKMEIHGEDETINLKELKRVLVKRALPISLLFFIMVFRTALILSITSFIAKIFEEWGFSRSVYSSANTVFMLFSAGGILAAGHLVSYIKPRKLLSISLSGFLPFFFLFVYFGVSRKLIPAMIFLAVTGFILNGGHALNIVMGHRVAPEMTSTISGILMGFAWAVASFGPPLCAHFSGIFPGIEGLASGLSLLTIFPIMAFILSIFLSREVDAAG
jgi:FSR family fosmidomycin resistance protein-like MFS transporter